MEKRLKKYTSIPQHLYVYRKADEQLKRIVDEMQRPGYVLVARQMGKTNLLFNAKRTLENENRLFVYVDLSNVFKYERECYRNIIDTIIEPNERLFLTIESEIDILREKKLPPHKEYSNSLRIILNIFAGDVVIILDEIDALRSADYSDNIFAQIRSNYFSRTNFPVFERLTYILSGVIEPTELIKDRNKSPFNIGDKIYLDDFTLNEHNTFILKSELEISESVSDKIYSWTNGNPRLTFDICSSIESLLLDNEKVTIEKLNQLIKQKYLTTYDVAPIDHIRELLKTNKKERNAVLKIQQNKNSNLSDEIKKKLYLFGIINSNFDQDIEIKNQIIQESLSIDWIKSIDREMQDDFSYGLELMENLEYQEAIDTLINYINNSKPNKDQIVVCNYNIGQAYYSLKKFEEAIEYLSKDYHLESYQRNSKSTLGICKIAVGEIEEGKKILNEITNEQKDDNAFRKAAFSLAPIVKSDDSKEALKLYDEVYQSTFRSEDDANNEDFNKLRALSQYYKFEIHLKNKENDKSIECLNEALRYSSVSDSVYIKFLIYTISESNNEKQKLEIINSIIDQKLKFEKFKSDPLSFNEVHLFNYLNLYFDPLNQTQFERLLNYSYNILYNQKISKFQIVYSSVNFSIQKEEVLKYILRNEIEVSDSILLKTYRDLALTTLRDTTEFFTFFNKYKDLFLKTDLLNKDDIYLFSLAIKFYSDKNKNHDGIKLCRALDVKINNIEDKELKFESVIIYYWYSILSFSLIKKDDAIKYANITIQLIAKSKNKITSMIDEKGLKNIVQQMNQVKRSFTRSTPIIKERKYGRNEKVKVKFKDGIIKEGKYKKFEADILAERCHII